MRRVVLADLTASWRVWAGLWLVLAYGAAVTVVGATELSTAAALAGQGGAAGVAGAGLVNSAVIYLCLGAVVVLTAVFVITRYLVRVKARSFALLQLAGMLPTQIARTFLAQIGVVFVVAVVTGSAVAPFVADFNINVVAPKVSEGTGPWPASIAITVDPLMYVAAVVAYAIAVSAASVVAVRRASRVRILDLLVHPDATGARRGRTARVIVFAILAAIAVCLRVTTIATGQPASNVAALAAVVALLAYLSAAPLVAGWVMRAWTSIVPPVLSATWFLAATSARYYVERSSAIITFIVVPSSLWSTLASLGTFGYGDGDKLGNLSFGLLVFGPSVVAALVFAGVALFMSAPDRSAERALVQVVGFSPRSSVAVATAEASIYSVTGGIIAVAVVLAGSSDLAIALPCVGVLTAAVFGLLLAVLVGPVLMGRRHSPVRALAAGA